MNIPKKYLILVLIIMMIFGSNASIAQDEPSTLRDLAAANEFFIGAAVYTYHLDDALHRDTFAQEFNMLTPEHEAKACQIQTGPGQFDFTRFDELVHFAEANDMVIRGHALVWHQCEAAWIENGDFSRDEAIDLLRVYISTVVGRYRGRIAIWDVGNEGVADNGSDLRDTPWRRLIGDDYIELAFQFAHQADPDAVLFYNDYGAEGINPKSDAIYELVTDFVERDIPIHGVGLQGHISVGDTASGGYLTPQLLGENIERIGELGLEVQITELDIKYLGETTDDVLQEQAADYYRITETCLNSEYCNALIVWGVADHFSWLRQPEYYRPYRK